MCGPICARSVVVGRFLCACPDPPRPSAPTCGPHHIRARQAGICRVASSLNSEVVMDLWRSLGPSELRKLMRTLSERCDGASCDALVRALQRSNAVTTLNAKNAHPKREPPAAAEDASAEASNVDSEIKPAVSLLTAASAASKAAEEAVAAPAAPGRRKLRSGRIVGSAAAAAEEAGGGKRAKKGGKAGSKKGAGSGADDDDAGTGGDGDGDDDETTTEATAAADAEAAAAAALPRGPRANVLATLDLLVLMMQMQVRESSPR